MNRAKPNQFVVRGFLASERISSDRGFSLIELLVASAVFICMVVILTGVIGSVTNISSEATAKLDAVRLGREIFDLIQRDLAQASSTRPSMGADVALQFTVNPSDSQVPPAYKNPSAFFWQAPISRDKTAGNLAVVGYFVQRISTNQSQLRRVLVEPNDTSNYSLYGTNTSSWLTSAMVGRFANSTGGAASTSVDRGWVANGVLGLWVRCLDANGALISKNGADTSLSGYSFDSRNGYRSGSGADTIVRTGVNALPAYVEVGLVCVASRDVDRIDKLPPFSPGSPATFDSDINAYLSTFQAQNPRVKTAAALTRRFRVPGGN